MNILAGATTDLRWDAATKGYKPAAEVADGPTFTIRALDFWQAQGVIDQTMPAVDRIRNGLRDGLVAIDGDAAKAAEFVKSPRATLVNDLFNEIMAAASGN